jgi:hypothetical protein
LSKFSITELGKMLFEVVDGGWLRVAEMGIQNVSLPSYPMKWGMTKQRSSSDRINRKGGIDEQERTELSMTGLGPGNATF